VVIHDLLDGMIGQQGQPVAFETRCRDRTAVFDVPSQTRNESNTPLEVASVTHKFISTKKYLMEYDWEGVYTDQEAAELLELARDEPDS
jgi:hypothetical protein